MRAKKGVVYHLLLFGLITITGVISLWLPYLLKLNLVSSDAPAINKVVEGFHFELVYLILSGFLASMYTIWKRRHITTLLLSGLILIFTYLLRLSIHSQWNIDHQYDSQTGSGYLLLVILVVVHFGTSGILLLSKSTDD